MCAINIQQIQSPDLHQVQCPRAHDAPETAPSIVVVNILNEEVEVRDINPSPQSLFFLVVGCKASGILLRVGPDWLDGICWMKPLLRLCCLPLGMGSSTRGTRYCVLPRRNSSWLPSPRSFGLRYHFVWLNQQRSRDVIISIVILSQPSWTRLLSDSATMSSATSRPRCGSCRCFKQVGIAVESRVAVFCCKTWHVVQVVVLELLLQVLLVHIQACVSFDIQVAVSISSQFLVKRPRPSRQRADLREDIGSHFEEGQIGFREGVIGRQELWSSLMALGRGLVWGRNERMQLAQREAVGFGGRSRFVIAFLKEF